jgi:hypothetical protein
MTGVADEVEGSPLASRLDAAGVGARRRPC